MAARYPILLIFFFFFFQHNHMATSSNADDHLCPAEQSLALFQFKHTFAIQRSLSDPDYCYFSHPRSYPKANHWNISSDCCQWDGVTCDTLSGNVIGLNLSCSMLSGIILPNSSLFELSHLQKLHLAGNNISLAPQTTYMLFQNFTQFKELSLSGVVMNSVLPKISSTSLTHLALDDTGLHGNLSEEVFQMPNLQKLSLANNLELVIYLPKFRWGCSKTLEELSLSNTGLSGELPYSIGYLKSLVSLELGACNLTGLIPRSIRNLSGLMWIDISENQLEGSIPDVFDELNHLDTVLLNDNNFSGSFPSSFTTLKNLELLYLYNNSLTGPLPHNISGFQNLFGLDLSWNYFSGTIPCWLFSLPSLVTLNLHSNKLSGELNNSVLLSISKQVNLTAIDLSSNNLNGSFDIEVLSSFKNLGLIHLSNNNLSIRSSRTNFSKNNFRSLSSLRLSSCKIKEFPGILSAMENLEHLDLSNNQIQGQIPQSVQSMWSLMTLKLQSNSIGGLLPSAICNMSYLQVLDLSHNNLAGEIPHCLGNFSHTLQVLDLHRNHFHGIIPSIYTNYIFRSLNLYGNQLEGTVPRSLQNCTSLQVLDLGNNRLKDTFPHWLEALPELQVLTLRSNSFHGDLDTNSVTEHPFPALQILDLSNNMFTGKLPHKYLTNLKAMMSISESNSRDQEYMGEGSDPIMSIYSRSYYSFTMVTKGVEREFTRTPADFATIDLSNNEFVGEIPSAVGDLQSLRNLNLSHNNLTGHIPSHFGNLSLLESLDLNSNQLIGQIPQELASLNFLEVLNVSHNRLSGRIPSGQQFNAFLDDSYEGNLALCGFPLPRCERGNTSQQPPAPEEDEDDSDFMSGFTWQSVLVGYGTGTLLGMVIGYVMFMIGKPIWFVRIIERECHRMARRLKARRGYQHYARRK